MCLWFESVKLASMTRPPSVFRFHGADCRYIMVEDMEEERTEEDVELDFSDMPNSECVQKIMETQRYSSAKILAKGGMGMACSVQLHQDFSRRVVKVALSEESEQLLAEAG